MYRDIFEEEMARGSVFKDQSKLSPDYVPGELVHREEEFRELIRLFRSVLEDRASQRVLITGSVGVGKTALTLRFGEEFESVAKKKGLDLTYVHINCRKQGTPPMVLHKLTSNLPLGVPRRGFTPQELMERVVDYLKKRDAYLTVTLDELDYFVRQNGPDLLYSLTRTAEESGGPSRLSMIATAHSSNFLDRVDDATKSTFMHNSIDLDKYNAEQLADILKQRMKVAFKSGMVEEGTIELISDISARRGDARFALELLWFAGRIASQGEVEEVSPNHVRKAKSKIHPGIRREVLGDLSKHELLFLLGLSRRLKISDGAYSVTGDVEEAYKVVCEEYGEEPRTHTQFWKYIGRIENLGLIDTELAGEGYRGRSQRISISDAPPDMMEDEIEELLDNLYKK
ncbi:hypothetical protein AKJ63_00705 [candidate division MSBL1 archaeon SCGC-AAA259D18]|uniref:ORC1-type DNA replication protein n=1 Tax=candidate division MSBL1 archaeon SCGC-AAA259D18 TaxID=1698262 RepID=A0A133UCD0_9EURY|nr:hypothetical protein AKJ63_00705 [candidate division MSBL1 archaeon SCGC-AAA259D18]